MLLNTCITCLTVNTLRVIIIHIKPAKSTFSQFSIIHPVLGFKAWTFCLMLVYLVLSTVQCVSIKTVYTNVLDLKWNTKTLKCWLPTLFTQCGWDHPLSWKSTFLPDCHRLIWNQHGGAKPKQWKTYDCPNTCRLLRTWVACCSVPVVF